MVSHKIINTIMTIISCMIMTYALTIGQVYTLQPVAVRIYRQTRDPASALAQGKWRSLSSGLLVTMISSPSHAERILLLQFIATSFLNA